MKEEEKLMFLFWNNLWSFWVYASTTVLYTAAGRNSMTFRLQFSKTSTFPIN